MTTPTSPTFDAVHFDDVSITRHVFFFDPHVAGTDALRADLPACSKSFGLDASLDGVVQIAQVLAGFANLESVQIVSHGAPGRMLLGNRTVSARTLPSQAALWDVVGRSLTAGGDLLLYGCEVGQGAVGAQFVRQLADLTGADVAASPRVNGLNERVVLDVLVGVVRAPVLDLRGYAGRLAVNETPTAGPISTGFDAAQTYAANVINPYGMALGDVNGDGLLDIVTDSDVSNQVSVLTGRAGGGFDAAQTYAVNASGPHGMTLGDVNGDGRLDIVTSDYASNVVSVLTGQAGGGFNTAQTYAVNGAVPQGVALGDVNGDGRLDIVTADSQSHQVSVLTGNASGGFDAAQAYATLGAYPGDVALGDMNGDGRLDIVATDWGSGQVSVLTGQAGGGFAAAQTYAVNGANPSGVALGDVNGDGRLDIVTADRGSNQVSVLTGQAGGGFDAAQTYAVNGAGPHGVALGDVNGDGRLDIVTANYASNQVSVLTGQAGGVFNAAQTYAVNGAGSWSVALGDMNGDGRLDIVTADMYSNQVSVLTQAGPTPASTAEDTALTLTLQGSDADGTLAGFRLSSLPANGTAYVDAEQTQVVTTDMVITATGNSAVLYFQPDANWSGSTSVSYLAVDDQGAESTVAAIQSIMVTALNDAPQADNAAQVLPDSAEDAPRVITSAELLAGWTDADADALSVLNLQVAQGTLQDNGDGSWTYTPAANASGDVQLTYQISDGQGGVSDASLQWSVTPVNDAPVLSGAALALPGLVEDQTLVLTGEMLLAGWSDADADALGVVNLTASTGQLVDNGDGSWTYSPELGASTPVTFNWQVADGQGGLSDASTSLELIGADNTPVHEGAPLVLLAGQENQADYVLLGSDLLQGWSNAYGDALSVQNVSADHGSFVDQGDGSWLYQSEAHYVGAVQVSYTVANAQGNQAVSQLSLTLDNVNDAPQLTGAITELAPGAEDSVYTLLESDLLAGWSDLDGDTLHVANLSASTGQLVDNGDGSWAYSAPADYFGPVTFSYGVTDGLSEPVAVERTLELASVNDVPVLVQPALDQQAAQGYAFSATLPAGMFADIEDASLSLSATLADGSTLPAWLSFDAATGVFSGTPTAADAGNPSRVLQVLVTATDADGASVSDTFDLTVYGSRTVNGTAAADTLQGNLADERFFGLAGNDTILGLGGNDTLDGGTGVDRLEGGVGDDSYVVDNAGDVLVEQVGEGTDSVSASVSYTLAANVENLTLTGTTAINATGNASANTLVGNTGANVLDGLGGADTMSGGAGNDTYVVDDAADAVVELAVQGTDLVQAGISYTLGANVENLTLVGTMAIDATGNALANTLTGNAAANVLDGLGGADRLVGLGGDDTYVLDSLSDVVVEAVGQGSDTVRSSVSGYTLGANVENLTLTGAATSGTGNTADNVLTGNAVASSLGGGAGNDRLIGQGGNDTLDGGTGADNLQGGAGNDRYTVDNAGDVLVEQVGEGTDSVSASITYTLAANVENLTLTGVAAIKATGNAGANTLIGNAGANVLDGLGGADTMSGGTGNDTYVIDDALDQVVELTNQGTDLVQAGISYTLGANVENLTLAGTTAIDATGNALANTLTGNAAANVLDGLGGADRLVGLGGDDTYVLDSLSDVVVEALSQGSDTVRSSVSGYTLGVNVENLTLTGAATSGSGNTGNNVITGNTVASSLGGGAGNDTLIGQGGNDSLDGGSGADRLQGGAGNDRYTVDNAGDVLVEQVGEGTDSVNASVSYTLADNLENLTLTGTTAINATGNASANTLTGNVGANVLDGLGGADRMVGAGGNDTYVVDDALDTVVELAAQGTDRVQASVSYTLATNVENLTLTGGGAIDATGNILSNLIGGNAADNRLAGGLGNDTLSGGSGADTFVFNTALNATTNFDTISDYNVSLDSFSLDDAIFTRLTGLTSLSADMFRSGAGVTTAADANDFVLYDSATGIVRYDADGAGGSAALQFARVSVGTVLGAGEFMVG